MTWWQVAVIAVLGLTVFPRIARRVVLHVARPEWQAPDNGTCPICDGAGQEETNHDPVTCATCAGSGRRPNHMLAPREAARVWQSARTLDDLGRATARWLRGELPTCLTYAGPADPETSDISGVLIALNEAGWLTEFSQPGHDWVAAGCDVDDRYRQRAAVSFLIDGSLVVGTVAAALRAGLWVDTRTAPRIGLWEDLRARCRRYPVSQSGRPDEGPWMTCGVGFAYPRSHWRWIGRTWRSRRIGRLLADAWQVTVVDPEWGENDRLWSTFAGKLIATAGAQP